MKAEELLTLPSCLSCELSLALVTKLTKSILLPLFREELWASVLMVVESVQ